MGLLDQYEGADISQGLLQFGQLAAQKRPFLGLLAGLAAADRSVAGRTEAQRQREMEERKLKLEEEFKRAQIGEYQAQAAQRQAAVAADQRRQNYLGSIDSSQGPALPFSAPQAFANGLNAQEISTLAPKQRNPLEQFSPISPKDYTPESVAQFVRTQDPSVLRPVQDNDKKPEALRTLALIYGEGTQAYQAAVQKLGEKMTSHQPGVSVSYQAPIPALNPATGQVELYRPDNKGGMTPTGIQPPPQNRDVKPPAEIQRMQIASQTMESLLNDYEGMLKKHNPRDPTTQLNPAIRADFQSLMKNLQLQFKEVQALGALAGPDLALMEQALTDPFTLKGALYGTGGLMNQIGQSRKLLRERTKATNQAIGRTATPEENDPLGLFGGK